MTRDVRTICPYCGVGCGLRAEVRDERVTGVAGDPDYPVNRGRLCAKPLGLPAAAHSPDRATVPLMRGARDRRFDACSWDRAIATLAERLLAIRSQHGPGAIAFYISGQLLTEDYYVVNKLAKGFLGTANVDSNSRLCMASAVAGYRGSLGSDGPPPGYADIEGASCFLLLGSNAAACHPIVWARIRERRAAGAYVIVVDPRRTPTAAAADLHLAVRPGTDLALLNAMLHVIDREGLADRDYVRRHTRGWDELLRVVADWPPERAERACGVAASAIVAAARRFATADAAMALWAVGANQSTVGTLNSHALVNLCLVTGQIGRPGAGPLSLTGQPNAMGGREAGGVAGSLPGYRSTASARDRSEIGALWRLPADAGGISPEPGLVATDLFEALERGAVRAVWICATNPVASMPDAERTRAALRRAELVVCQDAYHPTETSALAHVVLPAAQWPEKEGTMTNSERRVALVRKAIDPPGDALPDWEIFARLGRALGFEDAFGYASAAEVFDEFARTTAGRVCDQSGLSHERLRRGSVQWPCPAGQPAGDAGTERLYADHRYATPDGRARLVPTPPAPPAEPPDADYPLVLTTGRVASQWHTMTRTGKSRALRDSEPEPFLELHPLDAARFGVRDGERVTVESRRGGAVLTARVVDTVPAGTVFAPFHWAALHAPPGAGSVNAATTRASDPISRQPDLKACAVRVEPAARAAAPLARRPARRTRLVVVGGGMAGLATLEAALAHAPPSAWRATILGREPEPPYYRTRLSTALGSPHGPRCLALHEPSWYAARGLDLRTATDALRVDTERRVVTTSRGDRLPYDALVLATGSTPVLPRIDGLARAGVHGFRTVADAGAILASARCAARALVVGGGLLGLEVAHSLAEIGVDVTVVHLMDRLMDRHLDAPAAALLERRLRRAGIRTRCGVEAIAVLGERRARGLRLASGEELEGELVVVAVGIEPDVALARTAGLEVGRGVVVDDELRASAPGVWAVGECAEHRGIVYGIWGPLLEQARAAGASIAGQPAGFHGAIAQVTLRVADTDVFAAGRHSATIAGDSEAIVGEPDADQRQKLVVNGGRLVGAALVGDVSRAPRLCALMADGEEVTADVLAELVDPTRVPAIAPGAIVCGCNGVTRAAIVAAARDPRLARTAALTEETGAGAACGSCVPALEALLAELRSEASPRAPAADPGRRYARA
jgi:ferredoxin-nitrate reductase